MIDFNVAVKLERDDSKIRGSTGLKEWSAPETRHTLYSDLTIDCWTLGCIMFLLCTGAQPFSPTDKIEPHFNFIHKLTDYCESENFYEMVDFIDKLLVADPKIRLTAREALAHPWLKASQIPFRSLKD